MIELIYSSQEHKALIDLYINMCKEFAKDVSSKTKYNNYKDVMQVILEYHNGYGSGVEENNYYSWLMIIPINLSVATNAFFAGVETKRNRAVIRTYKVVLEEILQETVDKISILEKTNE